MTSDRAFEHTVIPFMIYDVELHLHIHSHSRQILVVLVLKLNVAARGKCSLAELALDRDNKAAVLVRVHRHCAGDDLCAVGRDGFSKEQAALVPVRARSVWPRAEADCLLVTAELDIEPAGHAVDEKRLRDSKAEWNLHLLQFLSRALGKIKCLRDWLVNDQDGRIKVAHYGLCKDLFGRRLFEAAEVDAIA